MKTLIPFLIALFMLVADVYAQHPAPEFIPDRALRTLSDLYPDAVNPQWMVGKNQYRVVFDQNGILHAVKYDKKGRLVEMLEAIEIADLPREVTEALSAKFPGYLAYEAEKAEMPNTVVQYNVNMSNEIEDLRVRVAPDGTILGKIKKISMYEWDSREN